MLKHVIFAGLCTQVNKELTDGTNSDVESLREELIACKVREAENDLLTKELQQKVMELDKLFQVVRLLVWIILFVVETSIND